MTSFSAALSINYSKLRAELSKRHQKRRIWYDEEHEEMADIPDFKFCSAFGETPGLPPVRRAIPFQRNLFDDLPR